MRDLQTSEKFDEILASQETCLIFKHSTTCPISAAAHQEVSSFEENAGVPIYLVKVIEHRPASNHIAEATGVKHESPQVLYVENGKVAWNASHWSITKQTLTEHIKNS